MQSGFDERTPPPTDIHFDRYTGDGGASVVSAGPAHNTANLHVVPHVFRVGNSGDGQTSSRSRMSPTLATIHVVDFADKMGTAPPAHMAERCGGDDFSGNGFLEKGRSENLQVLVNSPNVIEMPLSQLLTKPTPSAETWKLAGLVLIFFIWISTASTLLFLYMDRYLFG